jgi:hypothetical protein
MRNDYLIWINFSLMYVKGIPRLRMIFEAEQTEFPFTMSSPGHRRSQIGPHATAHGEYVVYHQGDDLTDFLNQRIRDYCIGCAESPICPDLIFGKGQVSFPSLA